jgi:hypothetical protein
MNYFDQIYGEPEVRIEFKPMHLPCSGTAYIDDGAGYGYRCDTCNAVVGSIGQPAQCKNEEQKFENWKKLGGKGWDYDKGCPK